VAEAQRQIDDHHIPGKGGEEQAIADQRPVNQSGRHHQRRHHQEPAHAAVACMAGIEPGLHADCQGFDLGVDRVIRTQRLQLLD